MPRPAKIWLRKSDGWYCTTHRGQKVRLSRDYEEARSAFHRLKADDAAPAPRVRPPFRRLAEQFLEHSRGSFEPSTTRTHERYLRSFCERHGDRRAPDLRGEHVTAWLKQHPGWGPSTRSLAIQAVKACLNWAVAEGKLPAHPLRSYKQGAIARRERVLTDEERAAIRARATGPFRDFLEILLLTGMRPFSEAARLEARMIDWKAGTATLPRHKNARHGKRRVVYLVPEAAAILRPLADSHTDGPLLRNRYGRPWDRFAFHKWGRIFARELGIEGVTAYTLRHDYISRAIAGGVPLPVVAELVGSSVKIILKNYCHLETKHDLLRQAAERAVQKPSDG